MSRYDFDDDDRYVVIENHSAGAGPFLVGLAVGAGLALLFAPRSGEATRRDIKRRAMRVRRAAEQVASDVADTVTDSFNDARRKVEEKLDAAREAVDMKREQVQRAMEAGRTAARQAREELENRIAETKAAYDAGVTVARNGGGRTLTEDSDAVEG